jgi:predicted dehydrogenase
MPTPYVITDPPGVALVGGGFIGPVHAEALRRIGIEVVGLLGSSEARARPLAQQLGIARVYRSLDELLDDPRVESVHIASPNEFHFEQARRALESGRHVVCEKPLATTTTETAELVRLASSRPRQGAAVNYNVRFYPLCHEMMVRVARGDIGPVLSVTGSYTQDWLLRPTDYNWRVAANDLRAVADIGTHWMDLAQFVAGRSIASVCADLATFHPIRQRASGPSETFSTSARPTEPVPVSSEDYGAVLLRFDDGARGVFHVSQACAGRKNRLWIEVAGTEGAMAWDSQAPDCLWLGKRGEPSGWLERDPSLLAPEAARFSHYPGGHVEGFADTFKQLDIAFYKWLAGGCVPPMPFPAFADGHREARLCAAIAESARNRMWIQVAS